MADHARLFDNADAFTQPLQTTVYCGRYAALEDSKQR
jgi:hypothetical protein